MSWLHTSIPLYQFLVLLTVYVLYKEFVKLCLKSVVRAIKQRRLRKQVAAGLISINEARQELNNEQAP